MTCPIDISTIIQLIQYCRQKVETVVSNKEACAVLADDLGLIEDILSTLDPVEELKADKHRLKSVMNKLYHITVRTKVLFDRCRSGKILIKIRNILCSSSIKQELQKLDAQVPVVIGMLNLVFHIKQISALNRSGISIPKIDESIFDEEDDEIRIPVKDYYDDDDDDDDD